MNKAASGETELKEWIRSLESGGEGAVLQLGNEWPELEAVDPEVTGATHLVLTFEISGFSKWTSIVTAVKKIVGEDEKVVGGVSEWCQPEKRVRLEEDRCGVMLVAPNELLCKIWEECFGNESGEAFRMEAAIQASMLFAFAMSDEEVEALLAGPEELPSWIFYRLAADTKHGMVVPYSTFSFLRLNNLFENRAVSRTSSNRISDRSSF
jgi:hypothetical protein